MDSQEESALGNCSLAPGGFPSRERLGIPNPGDFFPRRESENGRGLEKKKTRRPNMGGVAPTRHLFKDRQRQLRALGEGVRVEKGRGWMWFVGGPSQGARAKSKLK